MNTKCCRVKNGLVNYFRGDKKHLQRRHIYDSDKWYIIFLEVPLSIVILQSYISLKNSSKIQPHCTKHIQTCLIYAAKKDCLHFTHGQRWANLFSVFRNMMFCTDRGLWTIFCSAEVIKNTLETWELLLIPSLMLSQENDLPILRLFFLSLFPWLMH